MRITVLLDIGTRLYAVVAVGAVGATPLAALTAAEVAARATEVYEADAAGVKDYKCSFTSVRLDEEGKEAQRYAGYNYFKAPDKTGQEITAFYVKGEKKDLDEIKTESESYDMALPFDERYAADYTFADAGAATVAGKQCYILKFESAKKSGNYISGRAWVEADTYKLAALEATYYKNPKYVKEMVTKIWFADFGGHRMPQKLTAAGTFSAFLIFRGAFTLTEMYTDYRINCDVPDAKVQ